MCVWVCVCEETEEYKSVEEQFEEPDGIGGSGGHSGRTFLLLQFDWETEASGQSQKTQGYEWFYCLHDQFSS